MTIKKVQLTTASGEKFEAEEGVPIPSPEKNGATAKLRALNVGQSHLFKEYSRSEQLGRLMRQAGLSLKFTRRKEKTGVRVWRIE
jgi:hypothetical protein